MHTCEHARLLSRVQFFLNPCIVALHAPLSKGFSRQEYWSGLPSPPPGDLPDPGIESESPASTALHTDSWPLCYLGSPNSKWYCVKDLGYILIDLKQVYILCDRLGWEAKTDYEQLKSLTSTVLQKKEGRDRIPGEVFYLSWSDKASLLDLIQAQSQGGT